MSANQERHDRWAKLSAALRDAGAARRPDGEDLLAPPGFATRVAARFRADRRSDAAGLALWRRWSLAGAACAMLLCGGAFLLKPDHRPAEQIVPVPALDNLPDLPSQ